MNRFEELVRSFGSPLALGGFFSWSNLIHEAMERERERDRRIIEAMARVAPLHNPINVAVTIPMTNEQVLLDDSSAWDTWRELLDQLTTSLPFTFSEAGSNEPGWTPAWKTQLWNEARKTRWAR